MQATAQHLGDGTYKVTGSVSGASIVVDTRQRNSNDLRIARGPRPMELLLFGAATCSAVDLLQILEKMHHPAQDLVVEASGERAQGDPHRFESVFLRLRIFGEGIPLGAAERAAELAVGKYCSALASLNAEVTWAVSVESARAAVDECADGPGIDVFGSGG